MNVIAHVQPRTLPLRGGNAPAATLSKILLTQPYRCRNERLSCHDQTVFCDTQAQGPIRPSTVWDIWNDSPSQ